MNTNLHCLINDFIFKGEKCKLKLPLLKSLVVGYVKLPNLQSQLVGNMYFKNNQFHIQIFIRYC